MLAVLIRMIPAPDAEKARSVVVEEVVWAAAEPQDGLEHLTVVNDAEGRLGLMAFVSAVDKVRATAQARRLIDRAVRRAGALRGWSVVECSAVDLSREPSSDIDLIVPQGIRIFDM
ncbi:hypothetical protein M8Z33_17805 [Streptomyces sp. ZAF1911]|uniref:hypothetical protein n=1 Tax=unclassified Streptomyces TaxID=2593676 RepID=UPI00237A60FF|nr:hypothetical protein [Streptomyces sp. ZAF1911]MDD9378476.1 hypothetical protein [Streptomyces sp. ZAF1911]